MSSATGFAGNRRANNSSLEAFQERDAGNVPKVTYTRGNDLSGSLEGAGGIGGLLARSHGYDAGTGSWGTNNFYHSDGNGNITFMLNSGQSMVASYRFDPFGNAISSSGILANANVYRFSSKECQTNSGMYYYLYRFYDSGMQRWSNSDPAEERGGINLHAFTFNSPINLVDAWGLSSRPGLLGGGLGNGIYGLCKAVGNFCRKLPGTISHEISEKTKYVGLGGKCCNNSSSPTYYVDNDNWYELPAGQCTGTFVDCDGMMCGDNFYPVSLGGSIDCNNSGPACKTPITTHTYHDGIGTQIGGGPVKPVAIPNDRAHTFPPKPHIRGAS